MHGSYTEEMLGDRQFYWFAIEAAPSDSIHWMASEEVAAHGIATVIKAGSRKQPFGSQFGVELERICGACERLE
jgi:hypothetical protein